MARLGKRIGLSATDSGIELAGACAATCPATCKVIATTYCKCKNNKYANKGSGYSGNYNTEVHTYRTPDFG